ncbi:MAG: carboxylating nicotinate-nucleotide diphosphorylase [Cyanobacteria bacterium J06623_4]
MLPSWIVLDDLITRWLREDIGRGDQTTLGLGELVGREGRGHWVAKEKGIVAGLTVAGRVFYLLDSSVEFRSLVGEGDRIESGQKLAEMTGPLGTLLTAERVALNLAMRLSGIATASRQFADVIEDLPACLVDTRKTTPGLRVLEKYAAYIGGARNHRMGLDDGVMIKDNHIAAAGGIGKAIAAVRSRIPYPITVEVETENIEQVRAAVKHDADIVMLDNMPVETMRAAVDIIRNAKKRIKIEASGNITLETIRQVAETGVDYISSSAPITRSSWLDLSMRID